MKPPYVQINLHCLLLDINFWRKLSFAGFNASLAGRQDAVRGVSRCPAPSFPDKLTFRSSILVQSYMDLPPQPRELPATEAGQPNS